MDKISYLKKRYKTDDMETLECRVPFNFKDPKYESMNDKDYIEMIDYIERKEHEDIYEILKARGFVK